MRLRNQNQGQDNQNLISQINNFQNQIRQSGKNPEQLFNEVVNSGKYSQSQIEEAKQKARSLIKLFGQ